MPGYNVWAPRFSPFGSTLQALVHHGKRHYQESSGVYKANKLHDISEPSKKARVDMPPRRSYRRPRYALKSRRNYKRRRSMRRVRPVPSLWPRQKLVKFSVVGTLSGTTGAGALDTYILKANSLNDPLNTIGAELPLGLDQWAAMYQKYVIVGSNIEVHWGIGTGQAVVGIALKQDGTALTSHEQYMEMPLSKWRLTSADHDLVIQNHSYKGKKYEKIRDWKDAEDYQASFTTSPGDPTTIRYYHLFVQDTNSTEASNYEFVVKITFYALLFDSIIPARSTL